jgi:hypothetical protein
MGQKLASQRGPTVSRPVSHGLHSDFAQGRTAPQALGGQHSTEQLSTDNLRLGDPSSSSSLSFHFQKQHLFVAQPSPPPSSLNTALSVSHQHN